MPISIVVSVAAVPPGEPVDVLQDARQAGPGPDRLEALLGRAVEGDPERVQPLAKKTVDERVVEERRVGRHLGPQAQGLDGLDHVEDRRVGGRLAESAEHDRFEMGEAAELPDEPLERLGVHVAGGLLPSVADAGPAGEVAAGGRLDVQAVQAVDVRQDLRSPVVPCDLETGARGKAELLFEPGRDDKTSVFDVKLPRVTSGGLPGGKEAFFAFSQIGEEPVPSGMTGESLFIAHINICRYIHISNAAACQDDRSHPDSDRH